MRSLHPFYSTRSPCVLSQHHLPRAFAQHSCAISTTRLADVCEPHKKSSPPNGTPPYPAVVLHKVQHPNLPTNLPLFHTFPQHHYHTTSSASLMLYTKSPQSSHTTTPVALHQYFFIGTASAAASPESQSSSASRPSLTVPGLPPRPEIPLGPSPG